MASGISLAHAVSRHRDGYDGYRGAAGGQVDPGEGRAPNPLEGLRAGDVGLVGGGRTDPHGDRPERAGCLMMDVSAQDDPHVGARDRVAQAFRDRPVDGVWPSDHFGVLVELDLGQLPLVDPELYPR
jgi:hypothetical protein